MYYYDDFDSINVHQHVRNGEASIRATDEQKVRLVHAREFLEELRILCSLLSDPPAAKEQTKWAATNSTVFIFFDDAATPHSQSATTVSGSNVAHLAHNPSPPKKNTLIWNTKYNNMME